MQDPTLMSRPEEIETLIKSLYEPNTPEVIARTQSTLSSLQSSPQAWPLARYLLGRPDEKVKFFAALTVIVKLNTESTSLTDDDATELIVCLLGWYLNAVQQGNGHLVIRKLSSAIATFFHHFHYLWSRYLRHLIFCLATHQPCHPNAVDNSIEIVAILASLQPAQAQAALQVVTNVVEDVARFDLNAANNIGLYDAVILNMKDAVALMSRCIVQYSSASVAGDAIKCLQSWIWFAQRTSARDTCVAGSLRLLVTIVINSLNNEHLYEVSIEMLSDVLSNYPAIFTEQHYDLLLEIFDSQWFHQRYQRLIQYGLDFDSTQIGQLLLAFGEARVEELVQRSDERNRRLLFMLCGLLAVDGYPVAEDKLFVSAIEFWSAFAETMADYMISNQASTEASASSAQSSLLQAVSNVAQKIVYPAAADFANWDLSDRAGFSDVRKDAVDFLQSAYTILGPQLVVNFSCSMISTLSTQSWLQLEAATFCLGGLADCCRDDDRNDDALTLVFTSPLFSTVRNIELEVPSRVRQTCLLLIEQFTEYFQRNVEFLPAALTFLFSAVEDPSTSGASSKSIHRLCSSCRYHLYPEISVFLDQYRDLVARQQLDCVSCERILGALASLAQAVPDESPRYAVCTELFSFIWDEARQSILLAQSVHTWRSCREDGPRCPESSDGEHPGLHIGLRALRCLASVGRGFQALSDTAIDLEPGFAIQHAVDTELIDLQKQVIGIITLVRNTFYNSTEIMEIICSVLRTGFSETEPGPFVLSPEDVGYYLTMHTRNTPRIGVIVSTACSLISSLQPRQLPAKQGLLSDVLLWVIGLLKQLSDPGDEPEVTQNGIEFVTRLLIKSPVTFLQLSASGAAEFFFLFALQVLDGKEPLPKAAAADFWSIFVGLRNSELGSEDYVNHAMETLGPLLTQSIARNIGGNASRSELDKLSEPLKKLVSRHPKSREWLQSGLSHPSFPSPRVTQEQKLLFVKRVISLRGSRATNQAVRDFWLCARGSSFAYAS